MDGIETDFSTQTYVPGLHTQGVGHSVNRFADEFDSVSSSIPSNRTEGTMPGRKGRRDCRVGHRKKNHMNGRVEKLKKSIVRETKEAKKSGTAAESAGAAEPSTLPPAAADFLAQLRTETAQEVEKIRTAEVSSSISGNGGSTGSTSVAGSLSSKKKQRMVGGSGGGGW